MLKAITQVLSLLITVLLVNMLTEAEFGAYHTFIAALSIVGAIFSFGISNVLQRFIPKYAHKNEYTLVNKIAKITFFVRALSLSILCILGYIFRVEIAGFFNMSLYVGAILPFLFVVILYFQSRLLSTILGACLFQGVAQSAQLVLVLVKGFLYLLVAQYDFELKHVFFVDIAAYALMLAVVLVGYCKYIKPLKGIRKTFDKNERKDILKYAAYYNFNDIGVVLIGRDINIFFLATLEGIESAGVYAFANKISVSIMRISPVKYFIDVIRPVFFTFDKDSEPKRVGRYFVLLLKLNYLFELPLICALYVFYPYISEYVFGGKFMDQRLLVVSVFMLMVVASFGLYTGLLAQQKERADIMLYSKIFSIVNVAGNFILIPILGVYGAVISTFFSTLAKDLFVYYFVCHGIKIFRVVQFFFISGIYWSGVAVMTDSIAQLIEQPIFKGLVSIFICMGSYLIYIKFPLFNRDEISELHSLASKKKVGLKFIGI